MYDVALADRDGLMCLHASESGDETPAGGWVQARRLDSYSWPELLTYIKIDVEGAVHRWSGALNISTPSSVWAPARLNCWSPLRVGTTNFFLYRPALNKLVSFIPDAHGSFPQRVDDNVLAIHASAIDLVARRLCGLE